MGHGDRDDAVDHVGVQHGHAPGNEATPTLTDNDGGGFAEAADDCGNIAGQGHRVIAVRGVVGSAVAAQVHCYDVVTRISEGAKLMPPRPPEGGEAVQEDDQRTLASLHDVEAGTVGEDLAMVPRAGCLDDGVGLEEHGASALRQCG